MKLIESSYEIVPQAPGVMGMCKQVELAARNCYQSFDKITEKSYEKLLTHLGNNGHMSPFAHGSVYLKFPIDCNKDVYNHIKEYQDNFWSKVVIENGNTHGVPSESGYYVATNMRVIRENCWEDDLKYWCEPTEFHPKRTTVKINCSIGISRELNRHSTVLAIAESSTRYCNYSKDKFGNELTYVIPHWIIGRIKEVANSVESLTNLSNSYILDEPTTSDIICKHMRCLDRASNCWYESLEKAESDYLYLLTDECGLRPQDARSVLPLDTATTVYYTAFDSDWKEIFDKRTTTACHPDMLAIMIPLQEEFKNLNKI